ncbi:MAG: aldo/keto reductase [Verrucomicrobiota bacterium]
MTSRRNFLRTTAAGAASLTGGAFAATRASAATPPASAVAKSPFSLPTNDTAATPYRPLSRFGMGGVAMGNGFSPASEAELLGAMTAAWEEGVRYFDTSPWYGLGLSERRFGVFLQGKPRAEFALSTKIGRIFTPDASQGGKQVSIWHDVPPFAYHYDYSAEATRRSVEESLQRLGLAQLEIAFVHDLSPDNGDLGEDWVEHFEVARKGAFPELEKMKEEGLIKAWGMGVNTLPPALRSFEVANPDILLQATQYSLVKHTEALEQLFPVVEERGATIVLGAPLKAGFLAGRHRYLYGSRIPEGMLEKRARISRLAQEHDIDLLTAALHFCNAPSVVSSVIPGARTAHQVKQNAAAIRRRVPSEFWAALKREGLIAANAPTSS